MATPPLTHIALTVRDLSVSVPWYESILGAEPVLDEDTDPDMHHTVYLMGNGTLLGLHQHQTAAPPEREPRTARHGALRRSAGARAQGDRPRADPSTEAWP